MAANLTLPETIATQIRAAGPMSVATYMGLCLTHPREGYYKQAAPFGTAGDFITAPEISQMFGELIGFFVVNLWQQLDEPRRFTLLELGPGRGTLMADMLRVGAKAPGFLESMDLALFETHPDLVVQQKEKLDRYRPRWLESFALEGEGPLFVVANEFFDALPIRQFVKRDGAWHERMVGLDGENRAWGLSPSPLPDSVMPEAVHGAPEGSVYEAALAGVQMMTRLSEAVARRGGAILAIDYGYSYTQTGETLQGVRKHAFADVLDDPGNVDLSAHVDFQALGEAAREKGLKPWRVTQQGDFLRGLGIKARARALEAANPAQTESIRAALDRLTGDDAMGHLFKVLCATSGDLTPPGIEP